MTNVASGFPIIAGGVFIAGGMLKVANELATDAPTSNSTILELSFSGLSQESMPWWCKENQFFNTSTRICAVFEKVECNIYDTFTPESIVALAATFEALFTVILNPIIGAYCDQTSYRRHLFALFSATTAIAMGFQALLSTTTLILCLVLGVFEVVSQTVTGTIGSAYFPQCCPTEKEKMAVTSWCSAYFYLSQVVSIIVFTAIQIVFGLDFLGSAQMGAIGASIGIAASSFYSWKRFENVPPQKHAERKVSRCAGRSNL